MEYLIVGTVVISPLLVAVIVYFIKRGLGLDNTPQATAKVRSRSVPSGRGNGMLGWSLIVGVLIAAAVTNPQRGTHLSTVKERVRSEVQRRGGVDNLAASLGVTDLAVEMVGVKYNNYIVASTTTLGGRLVSCGVFKNVIVVE